MTTPGEREALSKVKLHKFGVVPIKVPIFGTVTASWDVTIPTDTAFDIDLTLNGETVAPEGSETFTLAQQTLFVLRASISDDPTVTRLLKQQSVAVDTSDCKTQPFPASLVTEPVKAAFDSALSGGGNFSLKPGGTSVTPGDAGLVDIHVPIAIDVPDWFDADMDIHIQLTITGTDQQVFVAAPVVDPQVSWSLLSNLLSFGCSDLVSSGMTQLSKVFLELIVDRQLRPFVTQLLVDIVNSFISMLEQNDPGHRTFVMTSLIFSAAEGLLITACPKS
jgi:hypothetical protein